MTERPGLSLSVSNAASAGPMLPVPDRIGRYHVIDRLASGGMAEVFICAERQSYGERLAALERLVVVKRILPHLAIHPAFVDMFLAEARYVARINHQNVVAIYELGEDNGLPFLSMEFVAGCSLRDLLVAAVSADSPLPPGVATALSVQACAGAHAAHELQDGHGKLIGLVHRDISPHNLMVTADGHVKLLDFGIAKATDVIGDANTRTGALKGKVHYMAPEQCKQQPLDRRADVFALGIVAWELFAKERLFKRDSELDAMQAIVTGQIKDLRAIRPDVPASLVDAIEKALHPKKETRFQTAEAFRLALLDGARGFDTSSDAVAAFVRPLLGKELSDRREAFAKAATERTAATGTGSPAGLSENESTVVDKPTNLQTQARYPTVSVEGSALQQSAVHETVLDAWKQAPATTEPTAPSKHRSLMAVPVASAARSSQKKQALMALFIAATSCIVVVSILLVALPRLRGPTPLGPPLVIAWPPTVDPAALAAELPALAELLQRSTHRPVELRLQPSYEATATALQDGSAAFAVLPPYLFVTTRRELPGLVPLATKVVDGSTGSDGVMLVREDSNINSLLDLKGKVFCFANVKSTTGYHLPRAKIREAGLDPDVDIIAHMSGDHTQVMKDLMAGVCVAGATYSGGYLAADRVGIPVGRARQLMLTGRSPQDVVVAAPSTSADDRALLQQALFDLNPKEQIHEDTIGKLERISGFCPPRLGDFEALEKAIP